MGTKTQLVFNNYWLLIEFSWKMCFILLYSIKWPLFWSNPT